MHEMISADEYFKKGLRLLGEMNLLGALACFEKANMREQSPLTQSFLGYCIANERGQIAEALNLCRAAIEADPRNPVHYLNLGRVYLKAKKKDEAIIELRRGLSFGDNQDIKSLLESLGIRRKPVFPFLSRSNFLNKYAGLVLNRLRLR